MAGRRTLPILPASIVKAPAADPLPRIMDQPRRAELAWLAFPGSEEGTPREQAAWAEFRRLEGPIETTVASTPERVAAQTEYMKGSHGDPRLEPDPDKQQTVDGVPVAFLNVMLAGLRKIGQ